MSWYVRFPWSVLKHGLDRWRDRKDRELESWAAEARTRDRGEPAHEEARLEAREGYHRARVAVLRRQLRDLLRRGRR